MKTERQIVKQIAELATELGRVEQEIKFRVNECVENTPESIKKHDDLLKDMSMTTSFLKDKINLLVNLFAE